MSTFNRIPCPECRKTFRTESGLSWHMFHIHGWKSAKQLETATPAKSIERSLSDAIDEETRLLELAETLGLDSKLAKQLLSEHLARRALLRQIQ